MTSKEALKRLYSCSMLKYDTAKQYAEVIEKDLEVLKILKKWVEVVENHDDLFPYEIRVKQGYISTRSGLWFSKDEYEKVKEWLENENSGLKK